MKEQLTLYVGVVRRGEFESLIQRNIPVGVIIDTNSSIRLPDLNKFCVVESCDFNGAERDLLHMVDRIKKEWNIVCVLVTHESYVLHGASVAEYLGLYGLSKEAARVCLDKTLMHERFVRYIGSQSTAKFMKIHAQEDLAEFSRDANFPIILKPTNLYNSLFVSLNHSQEELLHTYEQMLEGISAFFRKAGRYDLGLQVQAEEFLEGSIHSIDCIVDAFGNVSTTPVVDTLTGRDIGWDDFHHFARYAPSRLSASEQEALHQLAVASVRAVDIKSSVAHVELIQTAQGPKILEIGARPGGSRPRLFDLSCGIDLIYHYYQIRLGNTCSGSVTEVTSQRMTPTAIVSPYSRKQGVLTKLNHLDCIRHLKTHLHHEVKTSIGQLVGPSTQGYTSPLSIELRNDNAEDVYQDIKEIQSWQDIFVVS